MWFAWWLKSRKWAWAIRRRIFNLTHNYTEYNQQWNVFSAFNPSKCTHTWSSGQPTMQRPGSSWGFGALLKGLTSVEDNSCRSWDSNPQPRVTSPTLYPLGHGYLMDPLAHGCPMAIYYLNNLLKYCFLKHHGRNDLESAARARGVICRTVKIVQIITNASRISAETCYSTRWLFMNGSENLRLLVLS